MFCNRKDIYMLMCILIMVKKTLDDWNKIIKHESNITPEFEKEFPISAEAYRNGFKLKRFLKKIAYPLYFLFLYLSSLGTVFFIFSSIMLFFPLIFLFGDFGALCVGNLLIIFTQIFGNSIDFLMFFKFLLVISLIYSFLNEFIKLVLKKIFKLSFELKIYQEMLYFLGVYVGLAAISLIVALFLDFRLDVLGLHIITFSFGLIILIYKLFMLMIAKYLKKLIHSE